MFDLPDFDNDHYSSLIDYSIATTTHELEDYCLDIDIQGVQTTLVNDYLRKSWLNAVALARGISGPIPADRLSTYLTEIQSTWLPDLQSYFHIRFSPPAVRALCSHEAVLTFNLEEILFYDSADFNQ